MFLYTVVFQFTCARISIFFGFEFAFSVPQAVESPLYGAIHAVRLDPSCAMRKCNELLAMCLEALKRLMPDPRKSLTSSAEFEFREERPVA